MASPVSPLPGTWRSPGTARWCLVIEAESQPGTHSTALTAGILRTLGPAAGGWAQRLGESAASRIRLSPTLRHLAVTEPLESVSRSWSVLWNFESEGEFFCRPEGGGMLLSACEVLDTDADRLSVDSDCRAWPLASRWRASPRRLEEHAS